MPLHNSTGLPLPNISTNYSSLATQTSVWYMVQDIFLGMLHESEEDSPNKASQPDHGCSARASKPHNGSEASRLIEGK